MTAACQASLSFTISWSLLKLMSIESMMPSKHLILCVPLLLLLQSFPASGSFPVNGLFTSGGQSIGASASASVLALNIQGSFPSGLTCLSSLLSKGLSEVFSNTTVQKHQFKNTKSKYKEIELTVMGPFLFVRESPNPKSQSFGVITIFSFLRKNLSLQLLFSSTSNLL